MEGHFTFPCKAVVNFTMLQIWFFFVNNRMKSSAIFTSSLVCTLLCQISEDTFLQYQVILTFFWKYLLGRLKKIGFKNRKDSTNTQNEHQFLKRQNRIWFEDCERRAPRCYDQVNWVNSDMNTSQYYIFDLRQNRSRLSKFQSATALPGLPRRSTCHSIEPDTQYTQNCGDTFERALLVKAYWLSFVVRVGDSCILWLSLRILAFVL